MLLLVAATTIAFNPFGYHLFATLKLYLLVNLGLLLAPALLFRFSSGKAALLLPKPILALLGTIWLTMLLSTIFSPSPVISLIGKVPRYEGLAAWTIYFLLFLGAYAFFDNDAARARTTRLMTGLTLAVSLYALSQWSGFDFVKWNGEFSRGRAWSTLGNASTLGAWLALALPFTTFSGFRRWRSVGPLEKTVSASAAVLGLVAATLSGSRGAWLGLAAAFYLLWRKSTLSSESSLLSRRIIAICLAVLIFVGAIGAAIIESVRPTGSGRLIVWRAALPAVADRPLLGWGADTFEFIFPAYSTEDYEEIVTRETTIDNAHNLWLHHAVSHGLISALLLFALAASLLRGLTRSQDRRSDFALGAGAGLIGYLVALQFHFSTPAASPAFWTLAGAGLRAAAGTAGSGPSVEVSLKRPYLAIPMILAAALWAIAALFSASAVTADMELRRGFALAAADDHGGGAIHLTKAAALAPWEAYYPLAAGELLLASVRGSESRAALALAENMFARRAYLTLWTTVPLRDWPIRPWPATA